jgi:hypothetical protein
LNPFLGMSKIIMANKKNVPDCHPESKKKLALELLTFSHNLEISHTDEHVVSALHYQAAVLQRWSRCSCEVLPRSAPAPALPRCPRIGIFGCKDSASAAGACTCLGQGSCHDS